MTLDDALDRAAEALRSSSNILVTSHRRPDGDGCGGMVALTSIARRAGKTVTLFTPDRVPRRYKWMPLVATGVQRLPAGARFDATFVLDCADLSLCESTLPPPEARGLLIDLDHHASGVPFGDISVCDPDAAAAGVLVARLADRLGWPIDADAATGLYVSLTSDTGWFRHANTNGEALHVAARMVDCGAHPATISARLEERSSAPKLRLLGAALTNLETAVRGKVALVAVTQAMVTASGASWDDIEGLVNWARGVEGAQVGVLLTTSRGGGTRVSMRARIETIDVGQIALALGGGGHPGAAGCWLPEELPAARVRVIAALDAAFAAFAVDAASRRIAPT